MQFRPWVNRIPNLGLSPKEIKIVKQYLMIDVDVLQLSNRTLWLMLISQVLSVFESLFFSEGLLEIPEELHIVTQWRFMEQISHLSYKFPIWLNLRSKRKLCEVDALILQFEKYSPTLHAMPSMRHIFHFYLPIQIHERIFSFFLKFKWFKWLHISFSI